MNAALSFLTIISLVAFQAHAQNSKSSSQDSSKNQSYEFKGDLDGNRFEGQNLKFKTDSASTVPEPKVVEGEAEEALKLYPGYPRHLVALGLAPTRIASKWAYSGLDFNYNSVNGSAIDLNYSYIASPFFRVNAFYSRFEAGVNAGSVSAGASGTFQIEESRATVDTYGVSASFCNPFESNFMRQFCWGVELASEAYPLLDFVSSSALAMSKVEDLLLGVNATYRHPLRDQVEVSTTVGYSMGLGSGNSGSLTPKDNRFYYLNADLSWMVKPQHGVRAGVEYKNRATTVEGRRGNNDDSWDVDITTTAFQLSYLFSF